MNHVKGTRYLMHKSPNMSALKSALECDDNLSEFRDLARKRINSAIEAHETYREAAASLGLDYKALLRLRALMDKLPPTKTKARRAPLYGA